MKNLEWSDGMKKSYDVVVVGAGPAGIMACYELFETAKIKCVAYR